MRPDRHGSAPAGVPICTLEEQLRRAHDQLCLGADLFGLQAGRCGPVGRQLRGAQRVVCCVPDAGLSAASCAALSGWYEQASQELAATLDTLPAAVLNWAPDGPQAVEADAGAVRPGRAATEDGRDHHTGGDR